MIAITAQTPPKIWRLTSVYDENTNAHSTTKIQSRVDTAMKRMWNPLRDMSMFIVKDYLPKKAWNSIGSENANANMANKQKAKKSPIPNNQYTIFFS